MYRKYYSYSDMPQLVQKREEVKPECPKNDFIQDKCREDNKLFGKFEADDVLLAVIIVALLLDEGADGPLLLALAFVFLTGLL